MGKSLAGKELGLGISQNKNGLYVGRMTNRFGKRKSVYDKSLAKVRKKLREYREEDEKELTPISANVTLDEWVETWVEVCKAHCRKSTIRMYRDAYKRVQGELGWRKLDSLNLIVIQRAFNGLKTDMSRKKTKDVLVDILNCAVEADLLPKNPCVKVVTKIKGEKKCERHVLTDKEISIVLDTAKRMKSKFLNLIIVALGTGMRVGELCALTWTDIDFEKNEININHSLSHVDEWALGKPKSESAYRTIPMTKDVKDALLNQQKKCEEIYDRHASYKGFEELVFPSTQNHPMCISSITWGIRRILDKIEKEGKHVEPFTIHCIRHTFATKCIAKGMKPKVLQKILGHANLRITMDLYCHVEEDTVRDEMALVAVLA